MRNDIEEEEDDLEDDELDGDHLEYESTDSTTSANIITPEFIIGSQRDSSDNKVKSLQYLIKRSSTSSNAVYYNTRPCLSHQNSQQVCTGCPRKKCPHFLNNFNRMGTFFL